MSPQLTSQGMVLATTAAMAVSGTVILLALRLHHRTLSSDSRFHPPPEALLRPCISSSDERRSSRGDNKSKKKNKKKKRVRFADDVSDPGSVVDSNSNSDNNRSGGNLATSSGDKVRGIQANRMALYNGIVRDRVIQRMSYSY
ncbi:hypothetical protein MLD38_014406 [Melastoma candidum]|uniref:Uncharacterized protein n=1 Tax=Melastoma candidum TaxID=119954 RepID=A0ACB9RGU5_9MYRT|nr:hypothetical protein MLD38_014406 [Melastoma candidum]